jgi:signal transduction histidine kinase
VHGRIVGVLNVSQPPGCRPLEPEDQRALLSFADQAALAIEVARLYGESRRQVKELHQAVDDLAQAQAQLVQSEKLASVGVLAGGVAHEINNPLMIIGGRIELLLMRKDLPPPVREDLERVGRESTRISEIVKNLLAFSRAHRARARERLDVNAVVENTLQLVGHPLSVANIEIVRDLGKDLPAVEGYAGQLEQVFVNLAVNAMHAMENGGVLTIQTRRNPGGVVVEFADTGSGIAEEHLRKIFDPFFTTKPEGKGTGLGLSVSFGIIEAHGGEIGVESQVGQGTRFQVRLPAMAALDHTQKETSSHEQDARSRSGSG